MRLNQKRQACKNTVRANLMAASWEANHIWEGRSAFRFVRCHSRAEAQWASRPRTRLCDMRASLLSPPSAHDQRHRSPIHSKGQERKVTKRPDSDQGTAEGGGTCHHHSKSTQLPPGDSQAHLQAHATGPCRDYRDEGSTPATPTLFRGYWERCPPAKNEREIRLNKAKAFKKPALMI